MASPAAQPAGTPGLDKPLRPQPGGDKHVITGHAPLRLTSIINFRDLAMASNSMGCRPLKKGKVFRCSLPFRANELDAHVIGRDLGVKTVVDLRSTRELPPQTTARESASALASYVPYHTSRLHFELLDFNLKSVPCPPWYSLASAICCCCCRGGLKHTLTLAFTRSMAEAGLLSLYIGIIDNSGPKLAECLRAFLDESRYPLVINCSAGKDRTGVVAMLLMAFCGASDEAMVEEYNISEEWFEENKLIMAQRHPSTEMLELLAPMMRTPRGTMSGLLQHIKTTYSSVQDYGVSIGFDMDEQAALRRLLCEP